MTVRILIGDVLDRLRQMPDDIFDCVVTSPPYWGLRDYGVDGQIGLEETLAEHIDLMVEVFAEVRRVLSPTGTLWLNYGDCYATTPNGRSAAATKAQGDDDRGFVDKPFSTIGPVCAEGPPSTTTRATSPQTQKQTAPPSSKRIYAGGVLKPKDLCMLPNRLALALQVAGWWVRSEIIWAKPNPMTESVHDRPATAHEKIWLLSKSPKYHYDAAAVRQGRASDEDANGFRGGSYVGGQAGVRKAKGNRRPYKAPDGWDTGTGAHGSFHREGREKGKVSPAGKVRGETPRHKGHIQHTKLDQTPTGEGRNLRNYEPAPVKAWEIFAGGDDAVAKACEPASMQVWQMATRPFKGAHFATFPPELVERCLTAGCPAGGHVLDPFGGAGTTALVADRMGMDCTLIELNPEYAAIAEARIASDAGPITMALQTRLDVIPADQEEFAL